MTLEDTIADVRRAVDTLRTPGLGLPKPVVDMLEEKVNTLAADAVDWRSRAVPAMFAPAIRPKKSCEGGVHLTNGRLSVHPDAGKCTTCGEALPR